MLSLDSAEQTKLTKGRLRLGLWACSERDRHSLPVPSSPRKSTGESFPAAWSIWRRTRRMPLDTAMTRWRVAGSAVTSGSASFLGLALARLSSSCRRRAALATTEAATSMKSLWRSMNTGGALEMSAQSTPMAWRCAGGAWPGTSTGTQTKASFSRSWAGRP